MSISMYARLANKYNPELAVSRRTLLKASLAASAGLLLSNCSNENTFEGLPGARKRIIVVGAGFSGLSCAYELRSRGYDVLVLEARNRVGGRVLSFHDMVKNKTVEGGGELVGTNHLTWWNYAKKFKLPLYEIKWDEENEAPIVLGGKKLDKDTEKKIFDEMEEAHKPINEAAAAVNADMPWESPNAEALDAQSMGDWIRNAPVSDLTKKAIRAEFEGNEGVSMERMSYLAFLAMVKGAGLDKYWTDSETHRCGAGNQTLALKLAAALGDAVRLNAPVISIVTGNQRVMVTTEDGQRYTAEDVVLSVPPTVWNKIRFSPALPAALKPQMGTAVKFLAGVKKPFWKDAGMTSECLTDGDISMSWEATQGQEAAGPGAVLTCFSGGPAADRLHQKDPIQRQADYKRDIAAIYPAYPDNATDSRFMDWPADPWVQASYSFGAPRMTKIVGPTLFNGIETLHFAGEHTCWAFPGYMEGALSSGVKTAWKLAKRDKLV
jgi:monoamine oxidase